MLNYADLPKHEAERIAFATSQTYLSHRWTELEVHYLHNPGPGGKRWVAVVKGVTTYERETNKLTMLNAGTLERALKIISDTDIGIAVCEAAREWAEWNAVTIENGKGRPFRPATDREALEWLYGDIAEGDTFPRLVERDLGAKKSTVRMQLGDGRDVMVPLRALIPFIDRNAFRAAIKGNDRG
jgi:hypothetical protein